MNCKHCGSEWIKILSLRNHERHCIKNKNKIVLNPFRKKSNQYIKAKENGVVKCLSAEAKKKISLSCKGKTRQSDAGRRRISEAAKARGLGGVRHSKKIEYKGFLLGSSYELVLAIELDNNNVQWTVPGRINYIDPFGKERTYSADFYLPEYDVYLDPKNDYLIENVNKFLGFTDLEKINKVQEQNNVCVLVLNKNQLTWEYIKERLQSIKSDALAL